MEDGIEAPRLAELAGLSESQAASEAPRLLEAALRELGLAQLDDREFRLRVAQYHCRQILVGDVTPRFGNGQVWRSFLPDDPEVAGPFFELEERYDWEVTESEWKKKIDPDVMEAARRLLEVDTW